MLSACSLLFFFLSYTATATSYIYSLSLHDALPIFTSTFINYFSYLVFWGKWHYIKEKQKNRVTSTKTCRSYHSCYRRSEEHTSELQSRGHLVCRLLLEKKKTSKKRENE